MLWLYNILSGIAVIAYTPFILLKKGPDDRRAFITERFGLAEYKKTDIWVHAVSVGEVAGCLPFLKALKKEFPGKKIVLSTTTCTGQKIARDRFPEADRTMYIPMDAPFCTRRVAGLLRPEIFITVETELWPGLFQSLRRAGSHIVILNGRISEESLKGYERIRFFMRRVLSLIDYFYMQGEQDAERIRTLGADPARTGIMGNFKFDMEAQDLSPLPWLDAVAGDIFLAASTHKGEEEIILDAYASIKPAHPGTKLILAPRHPKRFDAVAGLIERRGLHYMRRTELTDSPSVVPSIILLDTIGELSRVFAKVAIAFIGGSLVPVGGHNILEPAYWAKPILFGPHMGNFPIARDFLDASAALQVRNAQEIAENVSDLLAHREQAVSIGMNAKKITSKNTGAVQKAINLVRRHIGTA